MDALGLGGGTFPPAPYSPQQLYQQQYQQSYPSQEQGFQLLYPSQEQPYPCQEQGLLLPRVQSRSSGTPALVATTPSPLPALPQVPLPQELRS